MFKKMLVPLDGSDLAEGILPHVVTVATLFHAQVTLLRVIDAPARTEMNVVNWRMRQAEAEAYLQQQTGYLDAAGLTVDSHLLQGPTAERIVEFAVQEGADLTILSSHGQGGTSTWNVSNIAQKVLQRGLTSILLVHAAQKKRGLENKVSYHRTLVPLDGSRRAECVLPVARVFAQQEQAQILLAHVTSRPFVFRRLPPTAAENASTEWLINHNYAGAAAYLQELAERIAGHVEIALPIGDSVALALHRLVAEEAIDLALFSAHGHSAQSQWVYGSVVSNFIANGSVPLLIVQDLPRPLRDQQQIAPPRRSALYRPIESASIVTGHTRKPRTAAEQLR